MKYEQKLFLMLIGVPASGKSYFIEHKLPKIYPNRKFAVISSDNILETIASQQGKTYSEVFRTDIKTATLEMWKNLQNAIVNEDNIIWDQTNLTPKVRKGKLTQLPKDYYKVAVFFETPNDEELQRRLSSRIGKNIPQFVMESMMTQIEIPTIDEGFDMIIDG